VTFAVAAAVPWLVRVRLAPTMTPPDGSVTVPRKVDVVTCARQGSETPASSTNLDENFFHSHIVKLHPKNLN
jgi:hypothetical protein